MKKVLVVGRSSMPADGPPIPDSVRSKIRSSEGLKEALEAMIQDAASKGYNIRVMQLEDVKKAVEWVAEVKTVLAGDQWDGFLIGNGIRGDERLTLCFEKLVQLCREVAAGTPMGFNTHPLDVLETVERICG